MVAVRTNDGFSIGWSVCNNLDVFDGYLAKHIALERAYNGTNKTPPKRMIWRQIEDNYVRFDAVQWTLKSIRNRAERYFRTKELTEN